MLCKLNIELINCSKLRPEFCITPNEDTKSNFSFII